MTLVVWQTKTCWSMLECWRRALKVRSGDERIGDFEGDFSRTSGQVKMLRPSGLMLSLEPSSVKPETIGSTFQR